MNSLDTSPSIGDSISTMLGWTYFVAWSVSFYPQIILNYRRKSVDGLSMDFLVYNVYGFSCYAIFNTAFYFSRGVQEEYAKRHDGHGNLVKPNDLVFAYHALILSLVTFLQSLHYGKDKRNSAPRASSMAKVYLFSTLAIIPFVYWGGSFYNVIYFLSFIKLGCSLIKYVPQVWMNFQRQSTVGWSIHNILLDFTGGLLSFAQLLVDAVREGGVAGAFGNPVKLGMGMISVGFDLVFLTQHYLLYTDRSDPKKDLIAESNRFERADGYQAIV